MVLSALLNGRFRLWQTSGHSRLPGYAASAESLTGSSTFPTHDPAVAAAAPAPGTPDYAAAARSHAAAAVPDAFEGLPVGFFSTFEGTVAGAGGVVADRDAATLAALEVWGFPTSRPQRDPNNANFVNQRFQRGIMHYDHATGVTRGLLLAHYFRAILSGIELPPDLVEQARSSRFFGQYCPNRPRWMCRPDELQGTDLTLAFEPQ